MAFVGVVENGNSAVLVTLGKGGALVDRRKIDLTHDLPTHPYHHEGSWAVGRYANSPWAKKITLPAAIALVERVRKAAAKGAESALAALATDAPEIECIALRVCPALPKTTKERIVDARAASMADSIMYREALANAGKARGWLVHWYERESVTRDAAKALGKKKLDAFLTAMGRQVGPPWQASHKLAATAALASMLTA
jgi:hypothetical protein